MHRRARDHARIIPARAGFTPGRSRGPRRTPDHPRSRGVYPAREQVDRTVRGSSPLARGLPSTATSAGCRCGIIPARAGFTAGPAHEVHGHGDHPRSRGVYAVLAAAGAGRALDHPRSRGVYSAPTGETDEIHGSSPLARGLPCWTGCWRPHLRIIPARAGFTAWGRGACRTRSDHPRSRGVYGRAPAGDWEASGSSPLARGLPGLEVDVGDDRRIIPARAGFTVHWGCADLGGADHPRSRGVYGRAPAGDWEASGSSPLARGLPFAAAPLDAHGGIIPARAGFTSPPTPPASAPWDHPRSRGVYLIPLAGAGARPGSSPLARGLPGRVGGGAARPRIIPARAGFTPSTRVTSPSGRDHPRSRGVYVACASHSSRRSGSSPLARGLQVDVGEEGLRPGIIPARAGFTPIRTAGPPITRDHPRSRGVYLRRAHSGAPDRGSSPLARGLLVVCQERVEGRRIIPARAGFTPSWPSSGPSTPDHPRSRGVYL